MEKQLPSENQSTNSPRVTPSPLNATKSKTITIPKVTKKLPNARLYQEPKEGIRTKRQKEAEIKAEIESREIAEKEIANEPDPFTILQERRKEEDDCLEFLDKNRAAIRKLNASVIENSCYSDYANFLLKRIRRQAESEMTLKTGFKESYTNKHVFKDNRKKRNEEYIEQRKADFSISQKRVNILSQKLQDEYENNIRYLIGRCQSVRQATEHNTISNLQSVTSHFSDVIIESTIIYSEISEALSFIPFYYIDLIPMFNQLSLCFDPKHPDIPEFMSNKLKVPLFNDMVRLFTTLLESFSPEMMTPKLFSRKCKAVCIIFKPLMFSDDDCISLTQSLGWKPVFVHEMNNVIDEICELLLNSTEDLVFFGFPRTPYELNAVNARMNAFISDEKKVSLIPKPVPTIQSPFDNIIELDLDDESILRDVTSRFVDPTNGNLYDIRYLSIEDENQIIRIKPSDDPYFDIPQFPSRSVTLKTNYEIIAKSNPSIFVKIPLENRNVTQEQVLQISSYLKSIPSPISPKYMPETMIPELVSSVSSVSEELKQFFVSQFALIEETYNNSILKVYQMLNSTHLSMVDHLQKARKEMLQYLYRPANSQHLVIEFQQWHSTQVERCMRRMQKVKDECSLRLSALREQLLQIELDRKTEEENKQKDLLNASFRLTLFEIISNAYTMLAQAEIDRWTATRSLMMDYNQIIVQAELVAPLPRKKLQIILDPSRADRKGKTMKKPTRTTPTSKSRLDGKLPSFDSPLPEAVDGFKKYVTEAASIYIPVTAPASTRNKARPTKDKNPYAIHRISATDEFQSAFRDDDAYLVNQLDRICNLAQDEIQAIQQAFDSFVEDSTQWIQNHYEKRKSISDTAIAYMLQKVNEEAQINQMIFLTHEKCTIDYTKLIVMNEESPKIPPPFPEQLYQLALNGQAEEIMKQVSMFEIEN